MPFKVLIPPVLCTADLASTPSAAVACAMAVLTHPPCELWVTVEPCDEQGSATGPPVRVYITRKRGNVAASIEEPL